jgi:hypothetical protein
VFNESLKNKRNMARNRSKKSGGATGGNKGPTTSSSPPKGSDVLDDVVLSPPKLSSSRVALVGLGLIALGMIGFYFIPGLIASDAKGHPIVNAFYCSVISLTTIGFGQ